ncbi:MAG: DNA-processing protein DprA [Fimbriimonas ginsengisoli]|nr:DNA-processing protein DprA [Fimbriimonas ginsengisoli]
MAIFVALYLPGAPRPAEPRRAGWRAAALAVEGLPELGLAESALRARGLWEEAAILQTRGLLAWAERAAARGKVLTALCPGFPPAWRRMASPPPALWRRGSVPDGPFLGIVGSRRIAPLVASFALEVGSEAARLGYGVVSGGAAGSDQAGVRGGIAAGAPCLMVLPTGLETAEARRLAGSCEGACLVSASPPREQFRSAAAMERNALIYAAAEATVVVQARFREGGAWAGAADALRRRIGRVIAREDPSSLAMRSLIALGAAPLSTPDALGEALAVGPLQPSLA